MKHSRVSSAVSLDTFSQGYQRLDKDSGFHKAKPFVKWAGGKRQLLPELRKRIPVSFNRYFEPMIGGGALFFDVAPGYGVLADVSEELMNAYVVIKEDVEELIEHLRRHEHSEEYFYRIRNVDRSDGFRHWSNLERASRLLYLNKTCFNGLYRENSKGEFNTPFGNYKNPTIVDPENLRACSRLLQTTALMLGSFENVLATAEQGDFVYFDPPYVPLNRTSSFTSYNKGGFGEETQIALAEVCRGLDAKGVRFMLSNSHTPFVLEHYKDFLIEEVEASRAINSRSEKRGRIKEVLVRNYS